MANDGDSAQRLIELERRMDLVFEHLKIDAPPLRLEPGQDVPGVQEMLNQGNRVGAISLVVQRTGMGLGEAKRVVDQMVGGS